MMKRVLILLLICLSNGWLFANHWTPSDSGHEDNMTLTGVIQINGVEQQSTTLEVGVFCGEECIGSGYPNYFMPTQRYVIQLLIYGEIGSPLTFKLYDSELDQELDLVSSETVTFNTNGYGSLSDPYILDFIEKSGTHWIPDDLGYEDNMTLMGVIQINGVEQQSTSLEVSVFCGEECRSTGMATYFFPTRRYIVQLLIFGESGDQLTFRLYDHASGQEYNFATSDLTAFVTNGYGTLGNPYVLNFTEGEPIPAFHFTTAGNWSKASNWSSGTLPGANDVVFIDANCTLNINVMVASLTVSTGQTLTLRSGKTLTVTGNLTNTATTGLVIKDGAQLINTSAYVGATMEKDIATYLNDIHGGWYTISSPMNRMEIEGSNFLTSSYDLYRYNETNLTYEEWENYKDNHQDFIFFEKGLGYLYANSSSFSPTFTGILNATNVILPLTCTERPKDPLSGFHLIGNPFPHVIYKGAGAAINNTNLASGYYTLANDSTWQVHTYNDAIYPGQGILVKTTVPTFLTIAKSNAMASSESIGAKQVMSVTISGGTGTDRAIVYFGQGTGLNKVAHPSATAPSISIQSEDGEYAIAYIADDSKSLELLFSNNQPGEFMLSVSIDKADFSYLHLIDKETRNNIDLLQQPSYSFTATGQEKAQRFMLVFD